MALQHLDDRIVEVALEVDAEAASRDRREVDVDGGGRRNTVLGEIVHQDRRAVGIEQLALQGGETMELLRRFHVLLELCHALDRLLLRVRKGERGSASPAYMPEWTVATPDRKSVGEGKRVV